MRLSAVIALVAGIALAAAWSGPDARATDEVGMQNADCRLPDGGNKGTVPGVGRRNPGQSPCGVWGTEQPVDTGAVAAFDVVTDDNGRIWVAIAYPDRAVGLYFTDDFGASWHGHWAYRADSAVEQLQLLTSQGDSTYLYLFMLQAAGSGDLWLARIRPDSAGFRVLPVAVGPDTIDDFSATLDRDNHYYLYCLYANEQRTGRTGTFTRSLDYGISWESGTDWWNAWDPHVTHTTGSTVHCVWRYAMNGAEIHYSFNRHYGASGRWQWYRVVSSGTDQCFDPAVAQSDTGVESQASVWACYTVGRRDSAIRDIEYSLSWDGGWNWAPGISFSEPFQDEWSPALVADRTGPNGYVGLCYLYSGRGSGDTVSVCWSCVNAYDLNDWLSPVRISRSFVSRAPGVAPKLVYAPGAPARLPLVFFSRARGQSSDGVWFTGAWIGAEVTPNTDTPGILSVSNPAGDKVSFTVNVEQAGRHSLTVYDLTGRKVCSLFSGTLAPGQRTWTWNRRTAAGAPVPAGVYLVQLAGPDVRSSRLLVLVR